MVPAGPAEELSGSLRVWADDIVSIWAWSVAAARLRGRAVTWVLAAFQCPGAGAGGPAESPAEGAQRADGCGR